MPPENEAPLNNDVQIAPSVDNVIDPSKVVEGPKVEGADTFAAFEQAQRDAEAAGVPDLFVKPGEPAKADPPKVDEPKVDEPKAEAPKKSAQERIRELTRRGKDAERERDAKDAELAEMRERLAALETGRAPAAEASDDDAPPDPNAKNADGSEKYAFGELDTQYVKDLARHEARQIVREEQRTRDEQRQQQAAAAQAEEAEQAWADQLETVAAEHPDFVEKVLDGATAGSWPCSREVGALIRDSEVGAKIAYHLATNLREAVALDNITDPLERARAFGRLEATLQAAPKPTPGKTVKLPSADPPAPQARGSNGQYSGTPTNFKDFEAKFQPVLDSQR